MTEIKYNSGAPVLRGMRADDFRVNVSNLEEVVIPGGVSTVTVQDQIFTRNSDATRLITAELSATTLEGVTYQSLTPAVATVSADGQLSHVSNGVCSIQVASKFGAAWAARTVKVPVSVTPGATVDVPVLGDGAVGSLRRHIARKIYEDIQGRTPGAGSQDLFTAAQYSTENPSATRNAAILGNYDFSFVSFCSKPADITYRTFVCQLISPRHALTAVHVVGVFDGTVTFRRPNGTFQTVSVVANKNLGEDVALLYFGEAVTGIQPVKLAPDTIKDKFFSFVLPNQDAAGIRPLPCYSLRHNPGRSAGTTIINTDSKHLRVASINYVYSSGNDSGTAVLSTTLADPDKTGWSAGAYENDSSSGYYVPINGELVLIMTQYFPHACPWLPAWADGLAGHMNEIAAEAGEISPSYSPQIVSLAGFNNY